MQGNNDMQFESNLVEDTNRQIGGKKKKKKKKKAKKTNDDEYGTENDTVNDE